MGVNINKVKFQGWGLFSIIILEFLLKILKWKQIVFFSNGPHPLSYKMHMILKDMFFQLLISEFFLTYHQTSKIRSQLLFSWTILCVNIFPSKNCICI